MAVSNLSIILASNVPKGISLWEKNVSRRYLDANSTILTAFVLNVLNLSSSP